MKYDVFISYSKLDQKIAEGVCGYLEQHRIRCFVAYRDILPAEVWAAKIVEALEETSMMIVVFSGNFNRSKQVDREMELASEANKPILTFRITDDAFIGAKKYYLKNINWIDAFPNPEKCFGTLYENVRKLLGKGKLQEDYNRHKIIREGYCLQDNSKASKNISQQLCSYRKAAEQGDADAQYNLGRCYYYGEGLEKDISQSIYWYCESAEQGYTTAQSQCNLGVCYQNGEGISKDFHQAVFWYRKAAEQGHANAQNNLGWCYQNGEGISKDFHQAVFWYRKAAEQGHANAQNNLGWCYQNGKGISRDFHQAVFWYRKAAEQGDADAQYNLGWCYQNGKGIKKDLFQADYWFRKAADQKYAGALNRLKELGC